jgi:hypothetical protein
METHIVASSAAPTITAIPPSPTSTASIDFALPHLSPLDLSVLTEDPSPGNGAGRLLTDELERILVGFASILDIVGSGLAVLESQTRPMDSVSKTGSSNFDFGSMRGSSDGIRERLDSLTSSATAGTTVRRT